MGFLKMVRGLLHIGAVQGTNQVTFNLSKYVTERSKYGNIKICCHLFFFFFIAKVKTTFCLCENSTSNESYNKMT